MALARKLQRVKVPTQELDINEHDRHVNFNYRQIEYYIELSENVPMNQRVFFLENMNVEHEL